MKADYPKLTMRELLDINLRRALSDGSIDEAERIAVEIDRIAGEPVDDDRRPARIDMWGCEA